MKHFCLMCLCLGFDAVVLADHKEPETEDSIKVEVVGKLRSGIFAIGGETTGTTITAKNITWELDFGENLGFRKIAEKLDGKRARVEGRLERRKGVEIKERWIVHVKDIQPARKTKTKEPPMDSAEANAAEPFKVLEIQQTGGFAGVKIDYRITPDGKFARKSNGDTFEGELKAEDAKSLKQAVADIEWENLPGELRNPFIADDFVYEMRFVIGDETHRVTADASSAGKNPQLKPILLAVNKMQSARR